jgi:hypothetical protein
MNAKQAKKARAAANQYATKNDLWNKGFTSVLSKWYRKLLSRFFPKYRKRYESWVGAWYKRVLKSLARQSYSQIHDEDYKAFLKARKKIGREKLKKFREQMKEAK